jgi:hypothetical protein
MGDVLELPGSARRQMKLDLERLLAYNERLRTVRRLYTLYFWGR